MGPGGPLSLALVPGWAADRAGDGMGPVGVGGVSGICSFRMSPPLRSSGPPLHTGRRGGERGVCVLVVDSSGPVLGYLMTLKCLITSF